MNPLILFIDQIIKLVFATPYIVISEPQMTIMDVGMSIGMGLRESP